MSLVGCDLSLSRWNHHLILTRKTSTVPGTLPGSCGAKSFGHAGDKFSRRRGACEESGDVKNEDCWKVRNDVLNWSCHQRNAATTPLSRSTTETKRSTDQPRMEYCDAKAERISTFVHRNVTVMVPLKERPLHWEEHIVLTGTSLFLLSPESAGTIIAKTYDRLETKAEHVEYFLVASDDSETHVGTNGNLEHEVQVSCAMPKMPTILQTRRNILWL